MTTRLSLEQKIQIVLWQAEFKNNNEVRRQFQKLYNTDPPRSETITAIMQRFRETGSVQELPRSGRPVTTTSAEAVANVERLVSNRPETSVRRGSTETGMSRSSYHRALEKLNLKCYRPQFVVDLSDDDCDRRAQFATDGLERFEQDEHILDKIIWSDEADFKLNGTVNRHNCTYWASENPQKQIPVKHSPQGLMVWCGMTSTGLIGPYYFDGPVTGDSYTAMLQEFLWPAIMRRRQIFQQDGAPAHYSQQARAWLDQHLPGRWIGRRGPCEWPARSPDLSPCDFFLWGHLRDLVYRTPPSTIPELRDRITAACGEIDAETCAHVCHSIPDRLRECLRLGGSQITK